MNRFAKGAIAGAAGIILLLSGAGTFALWNGSASAAAGTVQSGTMTIATDTAPGTWSVTDENGNVSTNVDMAKFHAVPGDTLTFTQALDITATGNNLSAVLGVTLNANYSSTDLFNALTKKASISVPGPLPSGVSWNGTAYTVNGGTGTTVLPVSVSLPFDSSITGTTAQGGTLDLSKLAFTLTQQ